MASPKEASRIQSIINFLKSNNNRANEFEIRDQFRLSEGTYYALKRQIKLNPRFQTLLRIISERGEADVWDYMVSKEIVQVEQ